MFCMLLFISVGYITFYYRYSCFVLYPDWGFPCFSLSCKANDRVYLAKTGHGLHFSLIVLFHVLCCSMYCFVSIVSFCVLFVCKCVLYYCHRMATQLQLTNISWPCIEHWPKHVAGTLSVCVCNIHARTHVVPLLISISCLNVSRSDDTAAAVVLSEAPGPSHQIRTACHLLDTSSIAGCGSYTGKKIKVRSLRPRGGVDE